jgi:phage gp36-like protein
MAYATHADMSARFDENTLKDLVSDTGTPVSSLSGDTKIEAALADASGRINSAVAAPTSAYTAADLSALTGDDLGYLKRLVCSLAMAYLLGRRPEKYGEDYKKIIESSEEEIERLRKGEHVFVTSAAKSGGLPEVDGLTITEYADLNNIRDRTKNFYPARGVPVSRQN